MINNAADLIKAGSLKTATVTVAGLEFRICEMSVVQRGKWIASARTDPNTAGAILVQMCTLDDSGKPLFGQESLDLDAILKLRAELVDGIAAEVVKLSGLEDEEEKKD